MHILCNEKLFNELWTASFTISLNDPKNEQCKPLNYVEIVEDLNGELSVFFELSLKQQLKIKPNQVSPINVSTY